MTTPVLPQRPPPGPLPPAAPPADPFPPSAELGDQLARLAEQVDIDRRNVEELARLRAVQSRD